MNYRCALGSYSIVLMASALARGDERCGIRERVILNAALTQTTCTALVPVKKDYTVQTKDVATEVPCTQMVPVCVKDPRTGQMRTEWRPQTVQRKATTTYILILPPEGPDTTKKEERKKMTLNVVIGHAPASIEVKSAVPRPPEK